MYCDGIIAANCSKQLLATLNQNLLLLYRYSTGTLPVLYRYSTGPLPVLCRYSTGTLPVLYRYSTGPLPVLSRYSTGTLPVLYRYSTGTLPVLYRFIAGFRKGDTSLPYTNRATLYNKNPPKNTLLVRLHHLCYRGCYYHNHFLNFWTSLIQIRRLWNLWFCSNFSRSFYTVWQNKLFYIEMLCHLNPIAWPYIRPSYI